VKKLREEEGHKLFERSEFLWPPQATTESREAEGQVFGRPFFCFFFFGRQRKEGFLWES